MYIYRSIYIYDTILALKETVYNVNLILYNDQMLERMKSISTE